MWFAQLEGQFALSNITKDATKFYYIISQLDRKYVTEVEDVITNPPPTVRYDSIKAELIRRLSLSEEQQHVCQLLMYEEVGDWRPTQFLHHLRTLTSMSVPSDGLCTLWMNHLLANIQAIIAMQAQAALDDVVQLVDKIAEVTPPPRAARVSSFGDDICTLTTHTDELAWQVAALSSSPSHPHSPSQTRRNARRSSRSGE